MDLSHIYGEDLQRQHKLRLFKGGKLKYKVGRELCIYFTLVFDENDVRWNYIASALCMPLVNKCFISTYLLLQSLYSIFQVVDGEMYPPLVSEVDVDMHYPPHVPESRRFAVGHEAFGLVPGLLMYATIWLREHNRVCDVLQEVHPDWDDERLFQTTRLILIGEGMHA